MSVDARLNQPTLKENAALAGVSRYRHAVVVDRPVTAVQTATTWTEHHGDAL